MWTITRILLGCGLLLLASCSNDTLKRNAYQSLQFMRQRECLQQHAKKCPQAQSYDAYQNQRNEVLKK